MNAVKRTLRAASWIFVAGTLSAATCPNPGPGPNLPPEKKGQISVTLSPNYGPDGNSMMTVYYTGLSIAPRNKKAIITGIQNTGSSPAYGKVQPLRFTPDGLKPAWAYADTLAAGAMVPSGVLPHEYPAGGRWEANSDSSMNGGAERSVRLTIFWEDPTP